MIVKAMVERYWLHGLFWLRPLPAVDLHQTPYCSISETQPQRAFWIAFCLD